MFTTSQEFEISRLWYFLWNWKRYITLSKFVQKLGITKSTFKPNLIKKFSRIKVYNAMALPIILAGSEIWTLRKKHKEWLTSFRLNFSEEQLGKPFVTTQGMKKF